jgi:hypothetical protein
MSSEASSMSEAGRAARPSLREGNHTGPAESAFGNKSSENIVGGERGNVVFLSSRRFNDVPGPKPAFPVGFRDAGQKQGTSNGREHHAGSVARDAQSNEMTEMDPEYVTPRELASEVKAIEERIDRRHAEVSGKIELLAQSMNTLTQAVSGSTSRVDAGLTHIDQRFTRIDENARSDIRHITDNLDKIRSSFDAELKSSRGEVRVFTITAIAAIVASVLAGLGIIYTSYGNIMQAFDLGRNTRTEQRDAQP